jgi:hypothetical protein
VKKFLKAEEDLDFIPIMPLNEADGDGADIEIPEQLSLLPLRNTVLFSRCGVAHYRRPRQKHQSCQRSLPQATN